MREMVIIHSAQQSKPDNEVVIALGRWLLYIAFSNLSQTMRGKYHEGDGYYIAFSNLSQTMRGKYHEGDGYYIAFSNLSQTMRG